MPVKRELGKGQMSLNYVVVMIILLVVAGTVIGIVTKVIKPPNIGPDSLDKFERECTNYCNAYKTGSGIEDLADFCSETTEYDFNGDKMKDDVVIKGGDVVWESKVHCFNLVSCEYKSNKKVKMRECINALCEKTGDNNTVNTIMKPGKTYKLNPSAALNFAEENVPEDERDIFIDPNSGSGLWNNNWWIKAKEEILKGCS